VLALLGTLMWLSLVAGPARLVTGLLGAARHLDRAQRAISAGALKRARFETLAGDAAADRAEGALSGPQPLLDVARAMPRVDRPLREVPALVAAARHSADAALGSLEVAQTALRGRHKIVEATEAGTRVRLDRVEAMGSLLEDVRVDLGAARDALAGIHLRNLPRRARGPVTSGIDRAQKASVVLSDALAGFKLLPAILGAEDRRLYLLAMQNSAELRGTGGSLLRFSVLRFDNGVPRLLPSQTVYKQVDIERRTLTIDLPTDAWYVRDISDAQRFGNANWSPDWPLSARLSLRYALESDPSFPEIDGMIAVDPLLMRELMPGVGPFETPGGRRISRSKIVPLVLHRAYGIYPNPGIRRIVLQQIVERFYDNLLEPRHPTELMQGMGAGLARKHMQIYLPRRNEMAFVERMNWDGAIERARDGDYLYVVAQNVGGNKLDYSAEQSHTITVRLGSGDARVSTRVRVRNGVFLPQPNYWLGNSGPCHRPMINVYVPGNAELLDADAPLPGGPPQCSSTIRRLDSPLPAIWSDGRPPEHRERGRKVWSATLEIPAGGSGSVGYTYRVPGAVVVERGRSVYRLVLQRQPKVWPDEVTVKLIPPGNARDVRAPGWRRVGDALEWRHALTTDTTLEVSWR
jgi:hypothetical protein